MNDVKDYLNAVDTVCRDCLFCDEYTCESCPIRRTVDELHEFAPMEIWIAYEDESCWKEYASLTERFIEENVDACFRFHSFTTFYETLCNLYANPIASWHWVFVKGKLITYGAMDGDIHDKIFPVEKVSIFNK